MGSACCVMIYYHFETLSETAEVGQKNKLSETCFNWKCMLVIKAKL